MEGYKYFAVILKSHLRNGINLFEKLWVKFYEVMRDYKEK